MQVRQHQPIAVLSVLSVTGGIMGFIKARSIPSLVAGVGVGGLMVVSSVRIHDGQSGGLELAAASSGIMLFPMLGRAIRTRAPVPIVMTLLAAASAGYYGKEVAEERERGVLFK